jgi:predicted phosphodiesterase
MTRVAVLADVHGNVPALEAVIEDVLSQQPDEVLVGGDLVGRGPCGKAVVRRVTDLGWRGVRGNHEDYLLAFRHKRVKNHWLTAPEWSAARWMAAELDQATADTIERLPLTVASEAAPQLRVVHGTPRSNAEGIGPWTSRQQVEAHFSEVEEPVLVCGHTHRPLECRLPSGLVVNVGAVGLPFNRDRRAQYAVFELGGDAPQVEFRQVEYDLSRTVRDYETSGFSSHGGATARLLKLELEHAAPFLVPFIEWARARGVPPLESEIGSFLDFYDPEESFRTFACRLRELQGEPRAAPEAH